MSNVDDDLRGHVLYAQKRLEKLSRKLAQGKYEKLGGYIDGCLDIEVRCGFDKWYRSAELLLACGGPTIRLDTNNCCISGSWGMDKYELFADRTVCEAIDEYLEDFFNENG